MTHIKNIHQELIKLSSEMLKEAGMSPAAIASLIAGGTALGLGGYGLGRVLEHKKSLQNRNLAFGAGLAAGTLAPDVVRRGTSMLRNITDVISPENPEITPPRADNYGPYY